jgi:hypothetical protein
MMVIYHCLCSEGYLVQTVIDLILLTENLDYTTPVILIENLVMFIGRHLRSREVCVVDLSIYSITTAFFRVEFKLGVRLVCRR